ncbi:amidohydrolase [Thermodesulfobacteriota bacterium]
MTDLILYNATILSSPKPSPDQKLIVIENGVIKDVNTNEALNRLKKKTHQVVDCSGMTVIPGLIDAHIHLHAFAESLISLNLRPENRIFSISDIQAEIRSVSQTLSPGTWIRGKGCHEFDLKEKRLPTRHDLDTAAPDHPVKLTHRSGHAHILNSPALKQVGITIETPDPPEGLIDRDIPSGEPNGVLFEMGEWLSKKVPSPDKKEMTLGMKQAGRQLVSMGITSVQDVSVHNDIERWREFRRWIKEGIVLPRISMFMGTSAFTKHPDIDFHTSDDVKRLGIVGVKIILDNTTGKRFPAQPDLDDIVLAVHRKGGQVAIHAIESSDIESACRAIAYAQQTVGRPDPRHRIEHGSVCRPKLAEKIASLGISVTTQPPFVYYNGDRYLNTVPADQIDHLYPVRTLLKNGVTVAGSSDCPVVSANPFIGMYAAMTRMTTGGNRLSPRQRITLSQAFKMYTKSAAVAVFEESIKGSISPGMLADLVVIEGDFARFNAEELKATVPVMTILGGKIVCDNR